MALINRKCVAICSNRESLKLNYLIEILFTKLHFQLFVNIWKLLEATYSSTTDTCIYLVDRCGWFLSVSTERSEAISQFIS
ncbi:unnamed protein product [Hermetia illucens]|uniref:Uncharacterized protein n=1 Tax=Hermetia illucens TaxID=343691 RepID=A0A7R8V8Q6_HERIL|nr:unnamed protein product [Hermetia illucens]